jgi:hypothetical protein
MRHDDFRTQEKAESADPLAPKLYALAVWGSTLLAAVPWVNAVILLVVMAVHGQLTVTPASRLICLARRLREGRGISDRALIVVSRDTSAAKKTLIFFDDDRYVSRMRTDGDAVERLRNRMAVGRSRELLLLADKRVPTVKVVRFVNVAREAGMRQINVAEKPNDRFWRVEVHGAA